MHLTCYVKPFLGLIRCPLHAVRALFYILQLQRQDLAWNSTESGGAISWELRQLSCFESGTLYDGVAFSSSSVAYRRKLAWNKLKMAIECLSNLDADFVQRFARAFICTDSWNGLAHEKQLTAIRCMHLSNVLLSARGSNISVTSR